MARRVLEVGKDDSTLRFSEAAVRLDNGHLDDGVKGARVDLDRCPLAVFVVAEPVRDTYGPEQDGDPDPLSKSIRAHGGLPSDECRERRARWPALL
jgi:hypothetical protein